MKLHRLVFLIGLCIACAGAATGVASDLQALVRMGTGQLHLRNDSAATFNITGYTLSSPGSTLLPQQWLPITDNLDQDGSGAVDTDDSWVVLSPLAPFPVTGDDLSEGVFTGDGGFIGVGQTVYLGDVWDTTLATDLEMLVSDINLDIFGVDISYLPEGDFNFDLTVDAADYTIWRNSLGMTGAGLAADADGNGTVEIADYTLWKNTFGDTGFTVPAAAASLLAPIAAMQVPEPGTLLLVATGSFLALAARRIHRSIL